MRVVKTCSAVHTIVAEDRREEMLRAYAADFFPESALREIVESGGDHVMRRRHDRPTDAVERLRSSPDEEASPLQNLDRSVREAASILYGVIILLMIVAGFLVAFLFR